MTGQPPEPASLDEVIAGHLIRHHGWTEDDVAGCADLDAAHPAHDGSQQVSGNDGGVS